MRISSGRAASGQGGGGMPSMGGGAGGMERWEKEAIRSVMDWGAAGAVSAEGVGTVGVLLVVGVVVGLGGGLGKCLALYFWSTLSSIWGWWLALYEVGGWGHSLGRPFGIISDCPPACRRFPSRPPFRSAREPTQAPPVGLLAPPPQPFRHRSRRQARQTPAAGPRHRHSPGRQPGLPGLMAVSLVHR